MARAGLQVANGSRDTAGFGRDPLHLGSTRLNRGLPRRDRPARLSFFWYGFGIGDPHEAGFALAHHAASGTPTAILLPSTARIAQDAPHGVATDVGQAIGGAAQGALQGTQGPGGGAVLVPIGRPIRFRQDAGALLGGVGAGGTAPMARFEGSEALLVEAGDQLSDRIARAPTSGAGGTGVRVTSRDREQDLGAGHQRGGCAASPAKF